MFKLLIVDDEIEFSPIALLRHKFKEIEIYVAESGDEAVAKIPQIQPNLVITDWNMSNGDGSTVVRFCLDNKINPIIYTGGYEPEMASFKVPVLSKIEPNKLAHVIKTYFEEWKRRGKNGRENIQTVNCGRCRAVSDNA